MTKHLKSKIKDLSTLVGHFIRFWGFRKIHGEIWTVIYLSKLPLSGSEICGVLKVSKALVSPALRELEAEGLISKVGSENSKTKRYEAVENVMIIIRSVLKRREKPMIDKILRSHLALNRVRNLEEALNVERVVKMGLMIQIAQSTLQSFIDIDPEWK